ncbi:hypothetical protein [Nocardia sp. NPDC050710]|uniref:hypothetical protein n=1 Tax=Nocardia sp. NPDC050710 TaxID=3157220 RepID=UPI0033EEFE4A
MPNEIIPIDLNLLGYSLGAGLGVDLVHALTSSGSSSNASITSGANNHAAESHRFSSKM